VDCIPDSSDVVRVESSVEVVVDGSLNWVPVVAENSVVIGENTSADIGNIVNNL
jgi:hypothetical protein